MSPLYIKDGKLLVKGGNLATSANCCCGGCYCPTAPYDTLCSCLVMNIVYLDTPPEGSEYGPSFWSWTHKAGKFPSGEGSVDIPEYSGFTNITIPAGHLEYTCTADGPGGQKGWLFTYTMDGKSETWTLFAPVTSTDPQEPCCPATSPCEAPQTVEMSPDSIEEWHDPWGNPVRVTPYIYLGVVSPCPICEGAECLPTTWQLYDVTNGTILDFGNITKESDTEYILNGLEETFKPWGYRSKTFTVELRALCPGNPPEQIVLESWVVNIGNCGASRYPEHSYGTWTRQICDDSDIDVCLDENAGLKTVTLRPGGFSTTGTVDTFDGGFSQGISVDKFEYSNIFNWVGGNYHSLLPDINTDVLIKADCLSDGSVGGATCKDLTIEGTYEDLIDFGISIDAKGQVLVKYAHVIDQKYNSNCPAGRGIINASATGSSPLFYEASDGQTWQYNGAVQFRNNSRLSGTVNYTGMDEAAVTFDTCNITDGAGIQGGNYVYLNNTNICYISSPAGCLDAAIPVYNGKWILRGSSSNQGGIIYANQDVIFYETSSNLKGGPTNNNPGTITTYGISGGTVKFYDNSHNGYCTDTEPLAFITNNAEFYGNSYNAGKVGGTAKFYDDSYFDCGDIDGDIDFYDDSYNAGTLGNNTINFWDTSHNDGTINGCDITFNDDSYNTGHIECNP